MAYECWQEVINDYEKLLENGKGYDVIIYAGENEDVKEFHVHSNILSARSQYFCTTLSKEGIEKKDGKIIFKKPDISSQLFKIILRFIYCGKIDLTKLEGPELLKLSTAVNELNIHSLISRIEEYLFEHQSEFLNRNPIEVLEAVYQHESFKNLCDFCLEKICDEPEILFNSNKFVNLKVPLLELLLKRDDLKLDEIVIWDSLLKWGLAQNSSISQDSTKWSKEETTIMERTLHRCIPLVRFYHIPSEDFLDKVYPFKELLPKDFVKHPPRQSGQPKISIIVQPKHFAIFASWIDKKETSYYNVKNNPYNFNLLYRASRDGMNVEAFHDKCDHKQKTIAVAKIQNSDQIVGGYNPLIWDSSSNYKSTEDSFIFSFENRNNLKTAKVGHTNDATHSIAGNVNYGPSFGNFGNYDERLRDLMCTYSGTWTSLSCSYPDLSIPTRFNVDDYEVFQVIGK